jgi:hypothetical protein
LGSVYILAVPDADFTFGPQAFPSNINSARTMLLLLFCGERHSQAIILNETDQCVQTFVIIDKNINQAWSSGRGNTMPNGVFYEWLKN